MAGQTYYASMWVGKRGCVEVWEENDYRDASDAKKNARQKQKKNLQFHHGALFRIIK